MNILKGIYVPDEMLKTCNIKMYRFTQIPEGCPNSLDLPFPVRRTNKMLPLRGL